MKAGGNQLERGAIVGLTMDCITSGSGVKELTGPVSQTVYCWGSQCLVCLPCLGCCVCLPALSPTVWGLGVVWAGWLYPWEFSLPVFVWSSAPQTKPPTSTIDLNKPATKTQTLHPENPQKVLVVALQKEVRRGGRCSDEAVH